MNIPKSVVYVINVVDDDYVVGGRVQSDAMTKIEFVTQDFSTYGSAGQAEQSALLTRWLEGLRREYGVQWQRDPDDPEA